MNRLITYLLFTLIFIGSCKKPEEVEQPDPVFFFKGEVSGQEVDINAGENQYYMFTTYNKDSLNVHSFVGVLGKEGCAELDFCPGKMTLSIRENKGNLPIDDNIQVKKYDLRGPVQYLFEKYRMTLTSASNPITSQHIYDFGDGTFSNDVNPIKEVVNQADSLLNPSLVISSSTGCIGEIDYPVNLASNCNVDFFPRFQGGQLTWSPTPKLNRSELWDFGNGYLPLGPSNLPPADSIFTACVQSTDTLTGCVSYKCKNVILDSNLVNCVSNFDMLKEIIYTEDSYDYSEVTLEYEGSQGEKFSSMNFDQPSESYFEITKVEDYKMNLQGNPTKKITVKFQLRLFGEKESEYLDFITEKSVFAIAYP